MPRGEVPWGEVPGEGSQAVRMQGQGDVSKADPRGQGREKPGSGESWHARHWDQVRQNFLSTFLKALPSYSQLLQDLP